MDLGGATIAVTGATGFLGRYLVRTLQTRGARVVGVVRNPGRVPALAAAGVTLRRADLADREALAAGFAGADAVIANAALLVLAIRRWEEFARANVEGTEHVLAAAADAGVRRVVDISSVAVYRAHGVRIAEDAPQLDAGTRRTWARRYPLSKALAEQAAWRAAATRELALTVLRPSAIYGAFDPTFTRVFRRLVTLPVGLLPAGIRLALVYAGDVADAAARALERPASIGRAYNVTGDTDRTVWDFLRAWRAAGGPAAPVVVPVPAPLTRTYDHRRAEQELGWRNRPFVDALRETFALEAAEA